MTDLRKWLPLSILVLKSLSEYNVGLIGRPMSRSTGPSWRSTSSRVTSPTIIKSTSLSAFSLRVATEPYTNASEIRFREWRESGGVSCANTPTVFCDERADFREDGVVAVGFVVDLMAGGGALD